MTKPATLMFLNYNHTFVILLQQFQVFICIIIQGIKERNSIIKCNFTVNPNLNGILKFAMKVQHLLI